MSGQLVKEAAESKASENMELAAGLASMEQELVESSRSSLANSPEERDKVPHHEEEQLRHSTSRSSRKKGEAAGATDAAESESAAAMKSMESSELRARNLSMETEVDRGGQADGQFSMSRSTRLQHLLDQVSQELEFKENGVADAFEEDPEVQKRKVKQLEAVILSSRESHARLANELSELRVKMLVVEQGDQAANRIKNSGSGRDASFQKAGGRQGGYRVPGEQLTRIVEEVEGSGKEGEESDTEVQAKLKELTLELEQANKAKARLEADLANKAETESKVKQLQELLQQTRERDREHSEQLARLQESAEVRHSINEEMKAQHDAQEEHGQERAQAQEDEQQKIDVDILKQELFSANEAKRIASNRLEDMRQEMEATKRRCEQSTMELLAMRQNQQSMAESGVTSAKFEEMKETMRSAIEERNVLKHTLEWKEVQWQSSMEHLELENAELKRNKAGEIAKIKKEMDKTVQDLKRKLQAAEQEKEELMRRAPVSAPGQPPSSASGMAGLLAALKCPSRLTDAAGGGNAGVGQNSPTEAVHCRHVGWQLMTILPTSVALLCDVPGLKVLDFSEGARATWGDNMSGTLVVSLLASPTSAAWLRRAIVTHQNLVSLEGSPGEVPGFAVHALGQLEFRDSGGRHFESSVTVAHMPTEPRLGKAATVVVVVEPPARKQHVPERGQGGRRAGSMHGARAGSAVMSIANSAVSDDVQPSDSASNIAARYM